MKRHLMRLLSILLILSLVLGSGQAVQTSYAATSGTCGENLTWTLSDSGTLTISGTGRMYDYPRSSDSPWYSERGSITSIVIEDGVTYIGQLAFAFCSSLTGVTIGADVDSIGGAAFAQCTSLESVTIGEGVESIGDSAFSHCTSLGSVTIPGSVKSIEYTAFYDCTSLESVTIGEGVESIGDSAFTGCTSLESVTIPNSVEIIGKNAFFQCDSLESVTILSGSTTVYIMAFYDSQINVVYYAGSEAQWDAIKSAFPSEDMVQYKAFVNAGVKNKDLAGSVTGGGMYERDAEATLTAEPEGGCVFAGWEKDGQIVSTDNPWKFGFGNDGPWYVNVKAVFKKALTITANDQTYTYDGQPHGEGDPVYNDPDAIQQKVTVKGLLDGDMVTSIILTGAESDIGEYEDAIEITGFTINNKEVNKDIYDVTLVKGKLTIKKPDSYVYEITARANESTWGEVTGEGTYNERDSVTLKAAPNDGYVFDCWTEGGTRVDGTGAEYTFTASRARNLVANFREIVVSGVNIENTAYTGEPAVQDFSRAKIELNGVDVKLQEGTDYKFVYENNVDAGIATVRLDFIKDFTGSKSFSFEIKPKPVAIAAADEAFTYDGEAHSNARYTVKGMCGDDAVKAVVTGSITFPSESPVVNKIESYEFTSGKADNYDVTTADGQLTMEKAGVEITLTAGSGEWTYDGEAHGNSEVTVTSGSLFPGDELVASAEGSVTDVADSAEGNNPVADGYKILHGDEDVTENYVITTVAGTLTILPAVETPEEKPQKEKKEKEEPEEETLPFKDVQTADYFYDAVKWAWEKGMTAGVTEDLFGPAMGCTRAQFVTFLYGTAGSPEVSGDMPFSDVPEDVYFYKPVLWAYQNGITAGNSDGTFGAAQTVTRAQAVTMLYGMKGRPEASGDMPFGDVPEDAYYYTPVLWAFGQGITAGTGDGAFSPKDPCTRAQIVTMLHIALTE